MDVFGQEVAGADYRTVFDQTLPPGYFERWVADGPTFFQYDGPALQPWTFTRAEAAQITQPVLNMRGVNTQPYFRRVFRNNTDVAPAGRELRAAEGAAYHAPDESERRG